MIYIANYYLQKWYRADLEEIQFENNIPMTLAIPKIFFRNALEVVKFLFGNTMFNGKMHFCAERIFDENGKRLFNELWTSNWWWEIQVSTRGHREASNDV